MLTESLMILAAIGATFMTVALVADLLGLKVTTALAAGLAAWCWLSSAQIAFATHEQPVIAMHDGAKLALRVPAGKMLFDRYYERDIP